MNCKKESKPVHKPVHSNQFQLIYSLLIFFCDIKKNSNKKEFPDAFNLSVIRVEVDLGWYATWDKSSIDSDPLWLSQLSLYIYTLLYECFLRDIDSFNCFTHVWIKQLGSHQLGCMPGLYGNVIEACIGINLIREFFLSLVNFSLKELNQLFTWQTCVYILR